MGRLTEREALEERARIDAAMAQLESAKQRARAQRAEYGRYLEWKVRRQREERKRREEEEQQARERINGKLRAILQEHREQKRCDQRAWGRFATAKAPPPRPLRIADSFGREREYTEAVSAERQRRQEELERTREAIRAATATVAVATTGASMGASESRSRSAMSDSAARRVVPRSLRPLPQVHSGAPPQQQQQQSSQRGALGGAGLATTAGGLVVVSPSALGPATASVVAGVRAAAQASRLRGDTAATSAAGGDRAVSTDGGAAAGGLSSSSSDPLITPATQRVIEQSHANGALDLDAVAPMALIPEVEATQPSPLSPEDEQTRLDAAHTRRRVEARKRLVEGMYSKARQARLYATGRMLADPPADFLIAHDVTRYIPADLLADEPNGGLPTDAGKKGDGAGFFMTETAGSGGGEAAAGSSFPPDVRMGDTADGAGDGAVLAGARRKQLLWKKFDPNAWMKLPERPPELVAQPRRPDEESATLEWYTTYHERYTRVKKRTENTARPYNWAPLQRHVLPKLGSSKFDST